MVTCPHCGQSIKIGQARLTDEEIRRLPIGNEYNDDPTLIEWQCVKGAAVYYDVTDWTAKVDTSLTYSENIDLMVAKGTRFDRGGGATTKDLAAQEREQMRTR